MDLHIQVDDKLVQDVGQNIPRFIQESIAIRKYLDESLSLEQVAGIFEKNIVEMRIWLKSRGIDPT